MTDRVTEARLLRIRLAALEARADALGERAASGVPRMLAQVYNAGALPTANGKFFACHPATISGTEGENQVPSISVDSSQTIYVDVLGTKVPAAGDYLVCRRVDHRWVSWRGVATGGGAVNSTCDFTTGFTAATCTLTIGGNTYTLNRYTTAGNVTYQSDITVNNGNATFHTTSFAPLVAGSPSCPFTTGDADFFPILSCGAPPGNHIGLAVTIWPATCSGVRGWSKSNASFGDDHLVLTLTSYTNSPLNAVFSIRSTSLFGSTVPFTGNAVCTP